MRQILLLAVGIVFSLLTVAQTDQDLKVVTGELVRVIPSLKDLKPNPNVFPPVSRDLTGTIHKKSWKEEIVDYGSKATGDPVVQRAFVNPRSEQDQKKNGLDELPLAGSKVIQNYDGMGFTNVAPADPCMANGPNHVVQMINGSQGSYFRIWDKNGGNVVAQTYMNLLFPIVPGDAFWGDPVVLYDQFADRWIFTEFAATSGVTSYANTLVIAVSQTNNPTGGWNVYKFVDNTVFIDYPHYAVWPDAIYGTSNDFNTTGTAYLGSSIMAFEKAKMVAGQPNPVMIRRQMTSTQYTKFISMGPVSISGNTPPSAGTPGYFMYYHDDNRTATTTDVDSLGIITMKPDFVTPANTVINFAQQIVTAAFKANVCASRNCIPSGGASGYDAISDRLMHRINYRNFGTYEAIVGTYTVDANFPATPTNAALRWFELRSNGGPYSVYQQGTYAPDANGRWMGSININSKGQIALAFNHSGAGLFASILFTGRNSTDPLGLMVYDEGVIKAGEAYGTFANRWGDYNDLTTDVTNDSVFWYTAMYGATNWKTRVASFKLEPLPLLDARLFSINSPAAGTAQCATSITPNITIRNAGTSTITDLKVFTQLDNNPAGAAYNWSGSLAASTSISFSLPTIIATPGNHILKIWSGSPNGGVDENTSNDTATAAFSILAPNPGPITQNFQPYSQTTLPAAWLPVLQSPVDLITWEKNSGAAAAAIRTARGLTDSTMAVIRFYDYGGAGQIDNLLSPVVDVLDADSIVVTFDRAHRPFSLTTGFNDELQLVITTDCGLTFTTVKKWNAMASGGAGALATVAGTQATAYVPPAAGTAIADNWKNERVDVKPFIGAATAIRVGFRTINSFGNNLYLDNINIVPIKLLRRDALVRTLVEPFSRLCTRNFTPVVEIGNLGKDTLKTVKVMFRIDNNPLDSVTFTGNLLSGAFTNITLKPFALAAGGKYVLTTYTKNPNGLDDQIPSNDTLRTTLTVFDPQPDPVKEGFEQSVFPPANWSLSTSGSAYSWERTTRAASEKTASALIRTYRFNSSNKRDELFSPLVQIGTPDSVYVQFDIAHATSKFPGSTATPLDTLEILLTTDCGRTFRSVYKKWGEELSTVGPNFPILSSDTVGFVPTSKSQWRTELVDVTKFVPGNSRFQVVFRATSNNGNNLYLDKIDISTVTLPARLKQMGYMIAPNPFDGSFAVRHLLPPANLKGLQVTNTAGQVVINRSFSGNASNYITVDMSRFASGAYQIKLIYDNKVITERIIKRK
jgi:hypothetical protein